MMKVIEIAEYQATCVPAPSPTTADMALASELAAGGDIEARLDVRWLANEMIDVKASSWVGVVRFSAVEIRVLPKLVGGQLKVLQMIEYTDRIDLLKHLPPDQQLTVAGDDLFELIVRLLTVEVRQLLRDGLIRDYRPTEETLTVMRGRLRVRDQFLRRYGALHMLDCAFDEYDGDVPENQLLAAALAAASNRVRNRKLRAETRTLFAVLSGICQFRPVDADWYMRRIHYDRRNSRYRSAHELARLILKGLALSDLHSAGAHGVTAFMLNMNSIFEEFVTALVRNALRGTLLQVSEQTVLRAVIVDESSNGTYSTIRPDLVITDSVSGRRVPIDIKYKLYGSKKLVPGDVYQLFTYAYAFGSAPDSSTAGLIYPTDSTSSGPNLRITPTTHVASAQIRAEGLNVRAVLDDLAGGSLGVVHTVIRNMIQRLSRLVSSDP